MSPSASVSSSPPSPASPDPVDHVERTDSHGAVFTARWPNPKCAVISAHGELDAANAQEFADWALRHADRTPRLILDLTGIEFFGTAGFSALHTFNVRCAGAGAEWVLVPGRAVQRLLRICDPDATFPVCDDVEQGLAAVCGEGHPLLQLVAKPR
jgi:anti-anti-sigma factor